MNPSSTPIPRQRPVEKRESLLRASILDTALELGVGTSQAVTQWMFSPIGEDDEERDSTLSPSLTYASTATSDESWPSYPSLNRIASDASTSTSLSNLKPNQSGDVQSPQQRTVQFETGAPRISDAIPVRPQQVSTSKQKKLRKPKHEGNGYDSDGGYVSDGTSKDKKKKKESKSKGDGNATGEESDGGYLSEMLARRRRKKKEKKERERVADAGPGTDDESDGGYLSSHSKKEKKSKKSSVDQGEDSDGGYLSESSKRKRFMFRLNSKSRKRQDSSDISQEDVIPPVPSLPPMNLPVAERFATTMFSDRAPSRTDTLTTMDSRADTPTTFASRADTPAWSFIERPSTSTQSDDRPSFADSTSRGPTPVPIPTPLASPNPSVVGLTSAFNDAQSVRTPSTDVLRAFGRQALTGTNPPRSPLSSSATTPDTVSPTKEESSMPSSYTVPTMGMPPPKRNPSQRRVPPQISAPNTQGLSVRTHHAVAKGEETSASASIPVTLTPPTPTPGTGWRMNSKTDKPDNIPSPALSTNTLPVTPSSSTFDSVPTSPSGATPSDSASPSPVPSPGAQSHIRSTSPIPTPINSIVRPSALAKYDIPPPSPPPAGPLPQPPTSSSAELGPAPPYSHARFSKDRPSRPGTADSDGSGSSQSHGKLATRFLRSVSPQPKSAPTGPLPPPPSQVSSSSRLSDRSSVQRSAPPVTGSIPVSVSPPSPPASEGGTPLFLQRIPSRQRGKEPPFPTQPLLPRNTPRLEVSSRTLRVSDDTGMQPPLSAGAVMDEAQSQRDQQGRLNVTWQPRSASALDHRRRDEDEGGAADRQSWVEYEDARDTLSVRTSTSSHPDVDSVLSALQDPPQDDHLLGSELYKPRSTEGTDEDAYDDDADDRYSMFTDDDTRSRVSILDKDRSADVRQKFLQRVEKMYSKEGIARGMVPPVPKLPSPSSPRWNFLQTYDSMTSVTYFEDWVSRGRKASHPSVELLISNYAITTELQQPLLDTGVYTIITVKIDISTRIVRSFQAQKATTITVLPVPDSDQTGGALCN
ncbi:hypothetical protein BC629DRAFT_1440867 [Irpex lacteus]|nr:hypothetical protein BC629DRAFT_1440867 [Irpex lacteus]